MIFDRAHLARLTLSSIVPTIIDLDDDVVEMGESSVHRNTLGTTVSDNEIEILEVQRDQLGRSRVSSRRSRSQSNDDDCWEILQYEPLPPEENETWLRCDDDGEIIDEIPTFSRTDVQTSTNDKNGQNDRHDKGRDGDQTDRFYVICRSSSRERRGQRDTNDRPDEHSRRDKYERPDKHMHKHKKKHKRSDKDDHLSKYDRLNKQDRYDRPDRLDRPNRSDEVSDRPKYSNPTSSQVPSAVILNHLEGSKRICEPESATAQNPGSRLIPADSADLQKMVAEAIEKIANKKVSGEATAGSREQNQELDKTDHHKKSKVSRSPGMICEILTTSQDKEEAPHIPAHSGVDHAPANLDFGSPIELQNQIGFNSSSPNNGPNCYSMIPSVMNLWTTNPGPSVVMPQQVGSFPLPPQPVPPPFPFMQPFTIGPVPRPQLIQPPASLSALPNGPPANLPRHWNSNVNRSRTEVQGPKPGTSSSNVRPGAPSVTRAPLTYCSFISNDQGSFYCIEHFIDTKRKRDVFYQCVTHADTMDINSDKKCRAIEALDQWEQHAIRRKNVVQPLVLTEKTNMKRVYDHLTNTKLKWERNRDQEKQKRWVKEERWKQLLSKLATYADLLASDLLKM